MTPKSRHFPFFSNLLFLLIILFPSTASSSSSPKISYFDHCGSIVPKYPPTDIFLSPFESFQISSGHFSGGEKLFSIDPGSSTETSDYSNVGQFEFQADYIHKAQSLDILQLGGSLSLQGPQFIINNHRRRRDESGFVSSRVYSSKYVRFDLSGFWSDSTGQICMVGIGTSHSYEGKPLHHSAVFKLNYPKISNISTSLVNGSVESLDRVDSLNFFEKISVLAYAQKNYSYIEFPPSIRDSCTNLKVPKETRRFEVDSLGSYIPKLVSVGLKLEYGSDCSGGNCYPFSLKNGSPPNFLSLSQIVFSAEGKFRTHIGFSNSTIHWFNYPLDPENTLVGEGFWDHEKNQMCLVACRVLANASVGDCTIGISLWFPLVFTIKSRSSVMGRLWSNKNKNDPDYFSTMSFGDFGGHTNLAPSMKYKYSVLDGASGCDGIKNTTNMGYRTYPNGGSRNDLSFTMSLTGGEGAAGGHAYPISLGDTVFAASFVETPREGLNATLWNVSYEISYTFYGNSSSPMRKHTQISAEGQYNTRNGHLCMVGCMYLSSSVLVKQANFEDSMDCNILINIQFPPMDPKEGDHLTGKIRSTREKRDPFYFEPLLLSSYIMYDEQATKSIWRMDIEILMVVISLTLSCIFIRSQILYAKKRRDVLPAISITMLLVMTLGYLLPLILNFKALLIMIQNKQNSYLGSGEWMVAKEVIIRVLTLIAFVLHLCMLQVAWSARSACEGRKDLWVAEQKTLKLCLVLYLAGAAIAWFVQSNSRSDKWKWEDLLSYAGFILDGFLFPQIVFNIFQRSQEKALSLAFYVGMTVIRISPHLYDLYRAHTTLPHFQSFYIYASPEVDFYSSAWDIIIPLAGILFAAFIFMQQRFGGNYILPRRLRKQDGYVTIAEISL